MKQSRAASLIEQVTSTAVGFGVALAAQAIFLPLLGVAADLHQNLAFAAIMTVLSIGRGYLLRRVFEALHVRRPLSPFAAAVLAERVRQVEVEGWDNTHDDAHARGELARAGAAYAIAAGLAGQYRSPPSWWPWRPAWWKPTDFRRDLVKAAALILAEGEKFDRARVPNRKEATK